MHSALTAPLLESSKIVWPSLSDPLLIACFVAIGVWLLMVGWYVFTTRPEPIEAAGPSMDLRPESPAIVNMLVNGCRPTAESVPATLLDLAAHEYIDIEEYGTEEVICRVNRVQPAGPIDPYAEMVLTHVKSEATDGIVVAQALTTGEKGRATAWFKRYRKAVEKDAEARGLVVNRWSTPMGKSLKVVGLAAGGIVMLFGALNDAFIPSLMAVAIVGLSLEQALIAVFGQYNPSPAGREAAAHWLGVRRYLEDNQAFRDATPGAVELWDRYMSYAAAMGLAGKAVRALPMGAEDDYRAWSAYGGNWREVRVMYPRFRVVWGRSPFEALLVAIAMGAFGLGVTWLSMQILDAARDVTSDTDDIAKWAEIGSLIGIGVGLFLMAMAARTLLIALFDFTTRREVTGEIIRMRSFKHDKNKYSYFIAVNDGKLPKVRAWRVKPQLYNSCTEDSIVRAVISPRLGHVFEISRVVASQPAR